MGSNFAFSSVLFWFGIAENRSVLAGPAAGVAVGAVV
jgi:hypothetical protein